MKKLLHIFDKKPTQEALIRTLASKVWERDELRKDEDRIYKERCILNDEINELVYKVISVEVSLEED